jgi:hypothetical protein
LHMPETVAGISKGIAASGRDGCEPICRVCL